MYTSSISISHVLLLAVSLFDAVNASLVNLDPRHKKHHGRTKPKVVIISMVSSSRYEFSGVKTDTLRSFHLKPKSGMAFRNSIYLPTTSRFRVYRHCSQMSIVQPTEKFAKSLLVKAVR